MKHPRRKNTRGRPPACQLCDWHNTNRHPGGCMPRAVASICGLLVCQGHVEIIQDIAADNGIVVEFTIENYAEAQRAS